MWYSGEMVVERNSTLACDNRPTSARKERLAGLEPATFHKQCSSIVFGQQILHMIQVNRFKG